MPVVKDRTERSKLLSEPDFKINREELSRQVTLVFCAFPWISLGLSLMNTGALATRFISDVVHLPSDAFVGQQFNKVFQFLFTSYGVALVVQMFHVTPLTMMTFYSGLNIWRQPVITYRQLTTFSVEVTNRWFLVMTSLIACFFVTIKLFVDFPSVPLFLVIKGLSVIFAFRLKILSLKQWSPKPEPLPSSLMITDATTEEEGNENPAGNDEENNNYNLNYFQNVQAACVNDNSFPVTPVVLSN